jgi:hypothetical protein
VEEERKESAVAMGRQIASLRDGRNRGGGGGERRERKGVSSSMGVEELRGRGRVADRVYETSTRLPL